MTIALIYKFDDKSVIINDFRVTFSNVSGTSQVDAINKFKKINDKMALFLAGNVEHWKEALTNLESVQEEITINNIFDSDGPLKVSLQSSLESISSENHSIMGAIGFFVNPSTNRNVTFGIKGQAGQGCNIYEVLNDTCLVIGSGSCIPDIQDSILQVASRFVTRNGCELIDVANFLRNELKLIFKNCGASSFEKLGISPIFAISTIESSTFKMIGEEIKGSFHSATNMEDIQYHYKYEMEDGSPVLFDYMSEIKIRIEDIYNYVTSTTSNIFDPEKLSSGFDPTSAYIEDRNMYIINQWVRGSINDLDENLDYTSTSQSIERIVYKIEKFIYNENILCKPKYIKLAERCLEDINLTESQKYNNTGFYNLILKSEVNEQEFEELISQNIYDHRWLEDKISNYSELYNDA